MWQYQQAAAGQLLGGSPTWKARAACLGCRWSCTPSSATHLPTCDASPCIYRMKLAALPLLLLAALLANSPRASAVIDRDHDHEFHIIEKAAPDEVLIQFEPGPRPKGPITAPGVVGEKGVPGSATVKEVVSTGEGGDLVVAKLTPGLTVEEAVAAFEKRSDVRIVEPNFRYSPASNSHLL